MKQLGDFLGRIAVCSFKCAISLCDLSSHVSRRVNIAWSSASAVRLASMIFRAVIRWSQDERTKIKGQSLKAKLSTDNPLTDQKIHFADDFHRARLQFWAVWLIKSGCLLFGTHRSRTMSGSTKSLDVLLLNLITDGAKPGAIPICVFKTLFSRIQAAFLIFIMIRLRALWIQK